MVAIAISACLKSIAALFEPKGNGSEVLLSSEDAGMAIDFLDNSYAVRTV